MSLSQTLRLGRSVLRQRQTLHKISARAFGGGGFTHPYGQDSRDWEFWDTPARAPPQQNLVFPHMITRRGSLAYLEYMCTTLGIWKSNEFAPLSGPFGTQDSPVMVPSERNSRIVGCSGGPGDQHGLIYFELKAGRKHMCSECGQFFMLDNRWRLHDPTTWRQFKPKGPMLPEMYRPHDAEKDITVAQLDLVIDQFKTTDQGRSEEECVEGRVFVKRAKAMHLYDKLEFDTASEVFDLVEEAQSQVQAFLKLDRTFWLSYRSYVHEEAGMAYPLEYAERLTNHGVEIEALDWMYAAWQKQSPIWAKKAELQDVLNSEPLVDRSQSAEKEKAWTHGKGPVTEEQLNAYVKALATQNNLTLEAEEVDAEKLAVLKALKDMNAANGEYFAHVVQGMQEKAKAWTALRKAGWVDLQDTDTSKTCSPDQLPFQFSFLSLFDDNGEEQPIKDKDSFVQGLFQTFRNLPDGKAPRVSGQIYKDADGLPYQYVPELAYVVESGETETPAFVPTAVNNSSIYESEMDRLGKQIVYADTEVEKEKVKVEA